MLRDLRKVHRFGNNLQIIHLPRLVRYKKKMRSAGRSIRAREGSKNSVGEGLGEEGPQLWNSAQIRKNKINGAFNRHCLLEKSVMLNEL